MNSDQLKNEMPFINTPQFPGQKRPGVPSIESIRKLISRQKKIKGYTFEVPNGNSQFNIELPGIARVFLGLVMYGANKPEEPTTPKLCCETFTEIDSMQFIINNELIIDQLDPNFISFGLMDTEYYFLPRPLSGQDTITITFTNNGGLSETAKMCVYYI
tara:strand:+ start:1627 stop:2103 length:477 start_codon:yes stop_codon:yes gene_type:complete